MSFAPILLKSALNARRPRGDEFIHRNSIWSTERHILPSLRRPASSLSRLSGKVSARFAISLRLRLAAISGIMSLGTSLRLSCGLVSLRWATVEGLSDFIVRSSECAL